MQNFRLWNKDNHEWELRSSCISSEGSLMLILKGDLLYPISAEAYILQRSSGKYDMSGTEVFEGDIIESQTGGQLIEIRYGEYQAYCPADMAYMDNVGFYAVSEGYPVMPIGDLNDYGLIAGNIFENPEMTAEC